MINNEIQLLTIQNTEYLNNINCKIVANRNKMLILRLIVSCFDELAPLSR